MGNSIEKYKKIFENEKFLRDGKEATMKNNPVFDGAGVRRVMEDIISEMKARPKASTVLDYGCGTAIQYHRAVPYFDGTKRTFQEYVGYRLAGFRRYDPAHPLYDVFPDGTYDIIVCTDVLEHVPMDEMPEVLAKMQSLCKEGTTLIFSIPTRPSSNAFADGENMHCTLLSAEEWSELFKEHFSKVKVILSLY